MCSTPGDAILPATSTESKSRWSVEPIGEQIQHILLPDDHHGEPFLRRPAQPVQQASPLPHAAAGDDPHPASGPARQDQQQGVHEVKVKQQQQLAASAAVHGTAAATSDVGDTVRPRPPGLPPGLPPVQRQPLP